VRAVALKPWRVWAANIAVRGDCFQAMPPEFFCGHLLATVHIGGLGQIIGFALLCVP
jgi:hypothetical protein